MRRKKKKKWDRKFWIPVLTEITGIIITSVGIFYESLYHADLGFVLISTGSVLIATGGLIFSKLKPWLEN